MAARRSFRDSWRWAMLPAYRCTVRTVWDPTRCSIWSYSAENRTESRGAQAREDFPNRDDHNWMKHTLCWVDAKGATRFDYRPVHLNTLTDEVESIPPKARTY